MTQFTVTAAFSKRSIALANLESLTVEHMCNFFFKTWITPPLIHSQCGICCASRLRRLSYCHILRKRLILFRPSFIPFNDWKTPEISFAFMCSVDHNTSSSTANCYCSSHTDFLALGSSPCKMLLASGTLCT